MAMVLANMWNACSTEPGGAVSAGGRRKGFAFTQGRLKQASHEQYCGKEASHECARGRATTSPVVMRERRRPDHDYDQVSHQ